MHKDCLVLSDAVRAVSRLVLHRRVPPAVVVDHVRRLREVESVSAGLQAQHEGRGRRGRAVEQLDLPLALRGGEPAVQERHRTPERLFDELLERLADLGVLREDERRLPVLEYRAQELHEPVRLASRDPASVESVANELEPRDEREDVALPALADAVVGKRRLVRRAVGRREHAVFAHLALLAYLARNGGIVLRAPQHERLECATELLSLGAPRIFRERTHEALFERLAVPEKSGVQEFLEAPDVRDGVLHRRSRERNPPRHAERAQGARGLGVRILYRLRLVEDDSAPSDLREIRMLPHEQRVARDDDIRRRYGPSESAPDVARVSLMHVHAERGGELRELVPPVREKSERRDDEERSARRPCGGQHPCDGLDRLAEAHVVREQRAESARRKARHPFRAPHLVVPQFAREALRRGCPRVDCGRYAAEIGNKRRESALHLHLLDLDAGYRADPQRERKRIRLRLRDLLERPQRLAQNAAVDFDPPVPEKHERGVLLEEEPYLVRRHLLAVHAHLQPDRRRVSRTSGLVAYFGGHCDARLLRHAGDGVSRLDEGARPAHDEILGLVLRKLRAEARLAGHRLKPPESAPDVRRLSERAVLAAPLRTSARDGEAILRGTEREARLAARTYVLLGAAVPLREVGCERAALGVFPPDETRAAPERHRPRVVQCLVALLLRVFAQRRDERGAHILVDPVVVDAERAPARVPAVVLLHEVRIEPALRDEFESLKLSRARRPHLRPSAPPADRRPKPRRPLPPSRPRRGSSCRRAAQRPDPAPPRGSRGGCAGRG